MANISSILAKGVGIAGLGVMAYDAHTMSKDYAQMYSTNKSTANLESLYYDTLSLSTPSHVKDKAKKAILNLEMDVSIDDTFHKVKGYMTSVGNYFVSKAIPLGLSALTLLTKGAVSKVSALGLIGYAAADFIGEFDKHK